MKRLLAILPLLFISLMSYAQPVDFSTYERVIQRGKVSIVRQSDDYRLIVGSLKNPKICLSLGNTAEQAAHRIDRIQRMGREDAYIQRNRLVAFCGESFFFNVSGTGEQQTYSLRTMDSSSRFSLSTRDVYAIREALLQ